MSFMSIIKMAQLQHVQFVEIDFMTVGVQYIIFTENDVIFTACPRAPLKAFLKYFNKLVH